MNARRSLLWGTALALAGGWLYTQRARAYARLHPDLRSPLLRWRTPPYTPLVMKILRRVLALIPEATDVNVQTHHIAATAGAPAVRVYVYTPVEVKQPGAAMLFIHGGGFIIGSARMYHATCAHFANALGIVVVNVDYRLAPETPFPGPLEDCYSALRWMAAQAESLGIDRTRIAISGESSGAGMAAALAQLAHDRGEVKPAFQHLVYPMLDDRTVLRQDHAGRGEFLWTATSNRLGWTSYLGYPPRMADAPAYAVPARRTDLTGLAPAWISVGTLDLFYPECVAYARRLNAAGVPCELDVVEGAYHGFDGMHPAASLSKAFVARKIEALCRGLQLEPIDATADLVPAHA